MSETTEKAGANGADPQPPIPTAPEVTKNLEEYVNGEPTAKAVTTEEILMGENYALRVMNLSQRKQLKEHELDALEAKLQHEQQEMMLFRKKLAAKYNIDFTKYELEAETGKIILARKR